MSMNLKENDRTNILKRVRLINDYFKDVWQTYERVMIIRRKNVKRNRQKVARIRELSQQNPHYQDNIDELSRTIGVDTRNGQIAPDPIDASDGYHHQVTNILPEQNDFKMDCNETRDAYRIEYRKRLIGVLYGYLYHTYGRGIPNQLGLYLDFSAIYRDEKAVFDDLMTWWDDRTNGETVQEYSEYHNQVIMHKEHQRYDRDAYRWMDDLVRKNDIERPSKKVIRTYKGGYDDGIISTPYRLGSSSVNALFYWLTMHRNLPVRSSLDPYQDIKFHSGMNRIRQSVVDNVRIYKDNSYSIRFHSSSIVDKVVRILESEKDSFQYEAYAHEIKQFPAAFRREAMDIPSLSGSIFNSNIHFRFNDTEHKAYAFVGLLDRTYRRFQDELIAQIQRGHIQGWCDWRYPDTLDNIQAYYQGIQTVLESFNIDAFQDMADYQNIDKEIVSNEGASFPGQYRNVHTVIQGLATAYQDHDIVRCYQVLGVKKGIELAFQNLPVAKRAIPEVFAKLARNY